MSEQGDAAFRVVRVERNTCVLLMSDGPRTVPTLIGVTVGDFALLDESGAVHQIRPRLTAIRRASASGQAVEQVLAANVDVVAVCTPLEADARPARLERLLALAWSSGARPILVGTKMDLCDPAAVPVALAQLSALSPGVDVIGISVADEDSLAPLRAAVVPDRTLVMLGASGVGKSSLINAILGRDTVVTGATRGDGKGRHTTAWRELVEIPGGGYLIDTPGLRSVSLSDDAQEGVDTVFAEIADLARHCRFNDCEHNGEPGCAVADAIESGRLDSGRLQRQRKLQRELQYQETRFDARARSEHAKRWTAKAKNSRPPRP